MQDSHVVYSAFETWIQEFDTDSGTEKSWQPGQMPLYKNVDYEEALDLFLLYRKEFGEFRPKLLRKFKNQDFSVLISKWLDAKRVQGDH